MSAGVMRGGITDYSDMVDLSPYSLVDTLVEYQ